MSAVEFVKKHGLSLTKAMISGAEGSFDYLDYVNLNYSNDAAGGHISISDLKRLVESHDNLGLLGGLNRGKEILKGAPEGSDSFVLWTGKARYLNSGTKCVFSDKSNDWSQANVMVLNLMVSFDALKEAIADVESCQ